MMVTRCDWATGDPLSLTYHDEEWGVPCFDEHRLFEFLILEGAQAGLSWRTILQKRKNFQLAFADFNPEKVARFSTKKIEQLLQNPGIIRNRLKITSAVKNARGFLVLQEEFGSFGRYLWSFVDNQPIVNHWHSQTQVPAKNTLSDHLSKELKQRGFNFVGSTICYSYLQAMGLVNDHLASCFCHPNFKP